MLIIIINFKSNPKWMFKKKQTKITCAAVFPLAFPRIDNSNLALLTQQILFL